MSERKPIREHKEDMQWHPAFVATMEIELKEYADVLEFEREHELTKKPVKIDLLIIKKNKNIEIKKNIGRIFKEINIVEYKSPSDYMSVRDFYKVLSYTAMYKAGSQAEDSVDIREMTMTFVSCRKPVKLMKHLSEIQHYRIEKQQEGIYYVYGSIVPIQIVVSSKLPTEENIWLKSLQTEVKDKKAVSYIMKECEANIRNENYEAYMYMMKEMNFKTIMEVIEMNRTQENKKILESYLHKWGLLEKYEEELRIITEEKQKERQKRIEEQKKLNTSIVKAYHSLRELNLTEDEIIDRLSAWFSMSKTEITQLIK